ncbi:MAG TPA: efflux RND transporter periplasmic adaptor subunit [Alphaproteobacteria bacterium]
MRTIAAIIVVLLLAAGAGGAYRYFAAQPAAQAGAGPGAGGPPGGFAMPVEAAPVRVGPSRQQVHAVGSLRSNESVTIRPEVAGRITRINFDEGQKVKRGQVLVQLDASVAQAELAQAQAALALARANYDRAEELARRGAGTQRALDEARARLRSDEAAVRLAEARLEKYTLVAPFDGVVGLRQVSIGDYVAAGTDMVNLEQIDPLKVDFRVPEIFLASVRPGQRISVAVDALPGREFGGEVYAIDPLVDAGGRSIVIRARIANPDDSLRPGLFARVTLTIDERAEALFVAEQSIVPVGDQHFVFKVVDGQQAGSKVVAYTPVKIGERRRGEVEIREGLRPGDVVVTAGLLKIRDGMPVQIVPGPSTPGAAPQGQPSAGRTGSRPAVAEHDGHQG